MNRGGHFDSEYASLMAELGETPASNDPLKSWSGPSTGHDITAGGTNIPPWRRPEVWAQPAPPPQQQYRPPQGGYGGGYPGGGYRGGGGYGGGYDGPPPQRVIYQQGPPKKSGGMGMGTALAAGGAGLLGGMLIGDAISDSYDDAYDAGE